ncbi:1169_t:CDS:2 [Dentiscutata erythropus]|uniref:1169_t:CDS:1 n=1 Tax=Dentiscutata erythropus TaxID=1348616 RepID=A0A9N9HI49_9GLOM|nr:1169_t:CDS:2 [Dentiscutata erythropus]
MGSKHSKYPKLIHKINKASDDKRNNAECPQLSKQDDLYIDRMQVFHHVMRCVCNGNFEVPLNEQLKEGGVVVLDFWWMASDFQNSTFVGIEKVSIYPEHKPKNVRIVQADVLETFPFPAFSDTQWRNHLIKEFVRVLKPGGYLECIDGDMVPDHSGVIVEQLHDAIEKTLIQAGRNPSLTQNFHEVIEPQPQMSKVAQTEFFMPIGPWGGKIGELGLSIMLHMMSGLKKGIMHYMKLNEKSLEQLWADYKTEVNTHHTRWKIIRYIYQKN